MLNWLVGNPRRFKTYVGNRVSSIVELIPPDRWNHVNGLENPAECASRGLFPSELLNFTLWWDGLKWLRLHPEEWPKQAALLPNDPSQEVCEVCLLATITPCQPVVSLDRFSSLTRLLRITAWVRRFVYNCRARKKEVSRIVDPLSVQELNQAKLYWIVLDHTLQTKSKLSKPKIEFNSLVLSYLSTHFWTRINYYELVVDKVTRSYHTNIH